MTNVPGATRSGLNRPTRPSMPTPTGPRLEKAATWSLASVMPSQGWLVMQVVLVWSAVEHFHTSLVMLRSCSMAPTVMTFLAVPATDGVRIAAVPSDSPPPALPAENDQQQRLGARDSRAGRRGPRHRSWRHEVVGLGVGADVVPTVVGDEGVGPGRGLLQVGVGGPGERAPGRKRPGHHPDRQGKEAGGGGHAAELGVGTDIGAVRAGGIGDRGGLAAAAGDDAGDVGAVAVGVHQCVGARRQRPRRSRSGCVASTPESLMFTSMLVPVKPR